MEPGRAPVALQGPAALVPVSFRTQFLAGCGHTPGPCVVSWKLLVEGRLRGPCAHPWLSVSAFASLVSFATLGQGRRACCCAQ